MKTSALVLSLATFIMTACFSTPEPVAESSQSEAKPASQAQASMEAKQVAAEQETSHVTEVDFKKGSAELDASDRKKIQAVLEKAKAEREIDSVKVISWADQSPTKDRMPKSQVSLADKRNDAIKDFLKNQDVRSEVDLHNMAEKPNAFEEMIGTSDARIKDSFADAETKVQRNSKAIVMVLLKDDAE